MISRGRGLLGAFALALLLVVLAPAVASAGNGGGGLQQCINQSMSCVKDANGQWVPDDGGGDDGTSDSGIPGFIGVFFVLAIAAGVGITIWRVTTARTLARQSGMDPNLATQMTLLSGDGGLDATYLAASLRDRRPAPPSHPDPAPDPTPPPAATRSSAERLSELKGLLDQGLVTQAEYDARRTAIIDGV
jgi:hypothetical protein